jgi:hypothetical protein
MRRRAWVRYIEEKFGVTLATRECELPVEELTATQSEIELIKYELVRHEAFRAGEPILAFKGRYGGFYVVDGHTRARVAWDTGAATILAMLATSGDADVCSELSRVAAEAGDGRERRIDQVPVVDRVGKGTPAWQVRRAELLAEWKAELEGQDGDEG